MYHATFQDCVSKNSDLTQDPILLGAYVSDEESAVCDVLADWRYRTELQEFSLNLADPLQCRFFNVQSDYLTRNHVSSASHAHTFREQETSDEADVLSEYAEFQLMLYS